MKYYKYLKYLVRHIWFVRKACWSKGLYWQGLVHDLSKWRLDEFIPYANALANPPKGDEVGHYDSTDSGNKKLDYARQLHYKRNPHHWQFWAIPMDNGELKLWEIPHKFRLEMLCDWWGISMALGKEGKSKTWYQENKNNLQFHPETRKWIEKNVSDNFI